MTRSDTMEVRGPGGTRVIPKAELSAWKARGFVPLKDWAPQEDQPKPKAKKAKE